MNEENKKSPKPSDILVGGVICIFFGWMGVFVAINCLFSKRKDIDDLNSSIIIFCLWYWIWFIL